MNRDIMLFIKTHMNIFTKAEKKVAQYILDHPGNVINMSITDLSYECGTGDTTVFRFCKTLNLQGYMEFKMLLAQSLYAQETTGEAARQEEDGSIDWICKKYLEDNINTLQETYSLLDTAKIAQTVSYMNNARQIYFFGIGSSYLSAQEAHYKFLRITDNVNSVMDPHFQTMAAALMTPEDVAIIFTHSGSSKDAIQIAKVLKKTGCTLVCITRFKKSPVSEASDVVLLCGDHETPLQGGSTTARIAQLYIIDLLFVEYGRQNSKRAMKNRVATSVAVSEKLL